MKIALIGYGKMGKEIEKIAISRGHTISLIVDEHNSSSITSQDLKKAEVAIEFSTPGTVLSNIQKCFDAQVPIVVGTTGWNKEEATIVDACKKNNNSIFFSSNYSLGVNIFFQINKQLAKLMSPYKNYNVSMEETHHVHKLDKPSGTAITIAEQVIQNFEAKKSWNIDNTNKNESLFIEVKREDEVPGTHKVAYSSEEDEITIEHKAYNRKGFALGAVLAAEYMNGKIGVYGMKDLLGLT